MIRKIAAACALAAIAASCTSGPGEQTPSALRSYLSALEQERLDDAFELTQLDEIADAFGPGAAITEAHFIASWTANPLVSYEITEIIRLRRRDIDDFGEGEAFFETKVTFTTQASTWTAQIAIEGEIAGTVIADAYPVRIEEVPESAAVHVDGVAVDVGADPRGTIHLLLLGGRHIVEFGSAQLLVEAEPLTIIEGSASIDPQDPGTIQLNGSDL